MRTGVLGVPGTGKSQSLLTALPWLERKKEKMIVFDCDSKLRDIKQFREFEEKGVLKIVDPEFDERDMSLVKQFRSNSAPSTEPAGLFRILTAIDDVNKNPDEYLVRVIDTLTALQEQTNKQISYEARKLHFEFAEWTTLQRKMKALFQGFFLTSEKRLCILNMHSHIIELEKTGDLILTPLIQGGFKDSAGQYFNELYLAQPKQVQGKVEYWWRVRPNDRVVARTTIFPQDKVEVKQDWVPVLEAI